MARQQLEIPGTERKTIKSIDNAAEELRSVRARRMLLTKEEADAADKLRKLLVKNGLSTYVYESDEMDDDDNPIKFDVLLESEDEPKVKVRKHKEPKKGKSAPEDDGEQSESTQ